jgi:hypothetical protein
MTAEVSAILNRGLCDFQIYFPCDIGGNVCSGIDDTKCIYSSPKSTLCS